MIWFIVFCLVLDVVQFAIVTAIDEIGVINDDMENAYNYPCIREISDNVAKALMLNPNHVIPVSNYFEETAPTAAKTPCLSLPFGAFAKLEKTTLSADGVKITCELISTDNSGLEINKLWIRFFYEIRAILTRMKCVFYS